MPRHLTWPLQLEVVLSKRTASLATPTAGAPSAHPLADDRFARPFRTSRRMVSGSRDPSEPRRLARGWIANLSSHHAVFRCAGPVLLPAPLFRSLTGSLQVSPSTRSASKSIRASSSARVRPAAGVSAQLGLTWGGRAGACREQVHHIHHLGRRQGDRGRQDVDVAVVRRLHRRPPPGGVPLRHLRLRVRHGRGQAQQALFHRLASRHLSANRFIARSWRGTGARTRPGSRTRWSSLRARTPCAEPSSASPSRSKAPTLPKSPSTPSWKSAPGVDRQMRKPKRASPDQERFSLFATSSLSQAEEEAGPMVCNAQG